MLVNLKEILAIAEERKCAVGAFNTPAEKLGTPVIIFQAELHENISPLEKIGPVMVQAAEKAGVPVCVQCSEITDLCLIAESVYSRFFRTRLCRQEFVRFPDDRMQDIL